MLLHELATGWSGTDQALPGRSARAGRADCVHCKSRGRACRTCGAREAAGRAAATHARRLSSLLDFPHRRIHGRLNRLQILLDVAEHPALNRPPEEVEFPHRRLKKGVAGNLKHDSFPSAEGVEELLGIGFELRLVVVVDKELLAGENIGNVVLLRIVCHEPVD